MDISSLVVVNLISIIATLHGGYALRGGKLASIGQFPYMVRVSQSNGGGLCGGVIIDETHVITAAHCVDQNTTYVIRAGVVDFRSSQSVSRRVSKVILHQDYRPVSNADTCSDRFNQVLEHDIAIVTFEEALPMDNRIGKISRATSQAEQECVPCWVAGWGFQGTADPTYRKLKWTTMAVLSSNSCAALRAYHTEDALCAIDIQLQSHIIGGDSGGPLVCKGVLVGIVSSSACSIGIPSIFMRVASYDDFIKSVTTDGVIT